MNRFSPILQNIDSRLNLPQPARSRIILEIAADLEDLFQNYRSQGLNEAEALNRAQEKIDMTDEALTELEAIHSSPLRKWMDKISQQARTRWERITLLCIVIFIAAISYQAVMATEILQVASKFIWPVLGIGVLAVILSIPKFYTLYIRKDHASKQLRRGIPFLLFLGGANLSLGILGYYFELVMARGKTVFLGLMGILSIPLEMDPQGMIHLTDRLLKCSSLIMISMLFTMLIVSIWFTLWNKIQRIEQAEAAILLKS